MYEECVLLLIVFMWKVQFILIKVMTLFFFFFFLKKTNALGFISCLTFKNVHCILLVVSEHQTIYNGFHTCA